MSETRPQQRALGTEGPRRPVPFVRPPLLLTTFEEGDAAFRAAFEHAAIGMALVDLDGNWLEVNRSLCQIVGYSQEELLATNFQCITHPDDLAADLTLVQRLLDGVIDHYHLEKRYLHKQGYTVWILLSAALVRDQSQQPCYFIAQVQDISESKRTGAAAYDPGVPATPRSMPAIVHAAGAAAVLVGLSVLAGWVFNIPLLKTWLPDLPPMQINAAIAFVLAGAALGLAATHEPRRGRAALCKITALGVVFIGAATLAQYAFGWNLHIDELIMPSGEPLSRIQFPGRIAPAAAANYIMLGVACLLIPATSIFSRRLFQCLVLTTLIYAAVALVGHIYRVEWIHGIQPYSSMALPTAITFLILCAGLLFVRPDLEVMAPLRSEHMGGTLARKLLPAVFIVPLVVAWLQLQGQQRDYYRLELGLALHTVALILVFSVVVWWGVWSLNQADRQRKGAERQVARHQAELAHVLRLNTMGEMTAGLAHEINQPLSAIANYAQGAARRLHSGHGSTSELLDAVNSIAEESARATEIVRSLKRYVKKRPPQRSLLNVNSVVEDAARIVAGEAREHGVSITLDCAAGLPQVSGDPVQLKQVLVNLLCNALDALDEVFREKLLLVETQLAKSGGVEVRVIDNGCGLPTLAGVDIFEAFMTTKTQGLGMGLAISRSIIEAHGGQLEAETNDYGGATFRFQLPAEHGPSYDV